MTPAPFRGSAVIGTGGDYVTKVTEQTIDKCLTLGLVWKYQARRGATQVLRQKGNK